MSGKKIIRILHKLWAEKFISPEDKNKYINDELLDNLERVDINGKILIEKAVDIWLDIIFNEEKQSKEAELFKKYLSNECIRELNKNKNDKLLQGILRLYADHWFPRIIEKAAKKAGVVWEIKRLEEAYSMWKYWWEGLKKWCIVYFEKNKMHINNTLDYMPWYQIPAISYRVKDGIIEQKTEKNI